MGGRRTKRDVKTSFQGRPLNCNTLFIELYKKKSCVGIAWPRTYKLFCMQHLNHVIMLSLWTVFPGNEFRYFYYVKKVAP